MGLMTSVGNVGMNPGLGPLKGNHQLHGKKRGHSSSHSPSSHQQEKTRGSREEEAAAFLAVEKGSSSLHASKKTMGSLTLCQTNMDAPPVGHCGPKSSKRVEKRSFREIT